MSIPDGLNSQDARGVKITIPSQHSECGVTHFARAIIDNRIKHTIKVSSRYRAMGVRLSNVKQTVNVNNRRAVTPKSD